MLAPGPHQQQSCPAPVTGHGPCHSTPTRRQPGRPDNARSTSAQVVTAAPPPPADRSGSRSPILDALAKAGVAFVALKENIRVEGKSNIQTKVMTTLFALFAEVERDLISERTREALPGPGPRAGGSAARKGSLGVFTARRQGGPKSSASSSWVKPSPYSVFLHESGRYPDLVPPRGCARSRR